MGECIGYLFITAILIRLFWAAFKSYARHMEAEAKFATMDIPIGAKWN